MTQAPGSGSLSASVLAHLDDLELMARIVIEGTRTGGNRSPFHGFTTEFHQHRPYRAGDDLKHLDWKLYGRSDRLYTRQYRETTNLAVTLIVDASASMAYPEHGVSKWQYTRIVAASLAYLVAEQGNTVGLSTVQGGTLTHLPARGGRPHLLALLARLDRLKAEGSFDAPRAIAGVGRLLRRRGVVILLSDCYDAEEESRRELRHLVQRGHDVTVLQLTSPDEVALPFSGAVEIEDVEAGTKRITDATAIASEYRRVVSAFHERCRMESVRAGIDYALLSTDVPPARALRHYLRHRESRSTNAQRPASA
ncbi:MAG: DUF58 domain-containing protein [Gemmatimonadetes bacterium]|nr:DUF58 domain-containing protein [Gemmatimonadota bacterium]MBP6443747.1 DUF58 domain-containing protein [Gemmatimonadales bacterium]MBP6571585.1 DUF58 domain-containing protein [Gemmatimonadales bacterium]MBP7621742.1 DUF58 domain-containing protein [Gemmatimonadales bacterium]MBP9897805.1 DUF58 domain-containing protein [Gemmatimonadales bacterium]